MVELSFLPSSSQRTLVLTITHSKDYHCRSLGVQQKSPKAQNWIHWGTVSLYLQHSVCLTHTLPPHPMAASLYTSKGVTYEPWQMACRKPAWHCGVGREHNLRTQHRPREKAFGRLSTTGLALQDQEKAHNLKNLRGHTKCRSGVSTVGSRSIHRKVVESLRSSNKTNWKCFSPEANQETLKGMTAS